MSNLTEALICALLMMTGWTVAFGVLPKYKEMSASVAIVHTLVAGLVPVAFAILAVTVWYLGS